MIKHITTFLFNLESFNKPPFHFYKYWTISFLKNLQAPIIYFPSTEREGPSHAPDIVPRTSMPHKPFLTDGCHYSSVTSPHDKKKAGTNATRGLGSKFSEEWMICVLFKRADKKWKEGQTSKNKCNLCFCNLWKGLIIKVTWGQCAEKIVENEKSSPPPVPRG